MHCARAKNGSLAGVYNRIPTWRQRWEQSAWALTIGLAAAVSLVCLALAG